MKKFMRKAEPLDPPSEAAPQQEKVEVSEEEQDLAAEVSKDKAISALKMAAEKLKKWKIKGSLSIEVDVLMLTLSYTLEVDFLEKGEEAAAPRKLAVTASPAELKDQGDDTLYLKSDMIRDPVGSSPRGQKQTDSYILRKMANGLENLRDKLVENAKKMKEAGFNGTVGVAITFAVPKILTFGEDVGMTVGIEVALTEMLAAQESFKKEQEKRKCRLDVWMKKTGRARAMNKDGTANLYAIVGIDGSRPRDKRRTKAVSSGTGEIEWKERLPPIPVAPIGEDEELVITIFHHNAIGADEFYDEVIIKLDMLGLKAGKSQDVWAVLKTLEEGDTTAPFLFFNLKYSETQVTEADLAPAPSALDIAPTGTGNFGLKIKVLECQGLKGTDKSGTSDPYVKINVDKHNFKTKVVKQNLNPQFNEEFVVQDLTHGSVLSAEVWSHNTFKDEFLGEFLIRMGMVRNSLEHPSNAGKPFEEAYALSGREGKNDQVTGKIRIAFTKA